MSNIHITASGFSTASIQLSANLKLTAGKLDTVQPIQTTSTPQFARMGLGVAADATVLLKAEGAFTSNFGQVYVHGIADHSYIVVDSDTAAKESGIIFEKVQVLKWSAYIPGGSNDLRFFDGTDRVTFQAGGHVGIGTTGPATSALLEMASTTATLLIPRMSTTQKNALTAVNGMIVYDNVLNKFQGFEAGAWTSFI